MINKRLLGSYRNGNYYVSIYEDGTKVRETEGDSFVPSFAENIDLKITDECDGGCPWCYEDAKPDGQHAALMAENEIEVLDKYIRNLRPFTEVALNGNDLSHPEILAFLVYLRKKKIITNITVSQKHFMRNYHRLMGWTERRLIHGLGISLIDSEDTEFLEKVKHFPNAVIHVISGVFNGVDLDNLAGRDLKLLILGYKEQGRGIDYKARNEQDMKYNVEWLEDAIKTELPGQFKVVSFDNLAIEQLHIKENLFDGKEAEWDEFYMGDDGEFTFYVDAVNRTYSRDSTVPSNERYPIEDKTADKMFRDIRRRQKR